MARHIRKGDMVMVTAGNDRGATGEVLRVIPRKDRVVVQGVNMRSKHIKPSQANPQGGILQREMPIHISNVRPMVDGAPTRVRFETRPDGSKVRVAVRDGTVLHTLRGPRREPATTDRKKTKRTTKRTTKTTTKTTTKKTGKTASRKTAPETAAKTGET